MATAGSLGVPNLKLQSPEKWGNRKAIKDVISKGWAKYGKYFKQASETSNIPVEILTAFAAVESNITPAQNGATAGIMQWNRLEGYANKVLSNEFKLGRMSEKEKEILKRKGVKWDANGNFQPITASQQLDPELNILIGSIYIGQYADSLFKGKKEFGNWGMSDDKIHMDRIIVHYNTGGGNKDGELARSGKYSSDQLAGLVNSTTSAYIKKFLGVNGAMDIITSDLKDVVK
jgi:soluble lytic murein transglycosylase-like protein